MIRSLTGIGISPTLMTSMTSTSSPELSGLSSAGGGGGGISMGGGGRSGRGGGGGGASSGKGGFDGKSATSVIDIKHSVIL